MDSSGKVQELKATVSDKSLSVTERRAALRLICALRGESDHAVTQIPEDDLGAVVAAMLNWPAGLKGLSCKDAADAVAEGRSRLAASSYRR